MAQIVTLQGKIAVTNTPQIFPTNLLQFSTLVISAKAGNSAPLVILNSPTASTAVDGTGAGYILPAGGQVTIPGGILNTNEFYIAGTSGDIFSALGA
jgi:hypothetical protein